MNQTEVIIIGAGLSGLYAATLLEKAGIDYTLLEGRSRIGGRILSVADHTEPSPAALNVDLGPAWVWPDFQVSLGALIEQLDIPLFAQNEHGDMVYEQSRQAAPQRHRGYVSSTASMRLSGGMRSLTDRLAVLLPAEKILMSHTVSHIEYLNSEVRVHSTMGDGSPSTHSVKHVFLALPPGLAANITFDPPLPDTLQRQWVNTATWMAPHAKYIAVYDSPFWLKQGLSGEARSSVGPMVEIHDASAPESSQGALFGFIGIPAKSRWTTDEYNLKKLCRAQLVRMFGPSADEPVAEFLKDWASDNFTAREADLMLPAGHNVPPAFAAAGPWQNLITGVGSEWSHEFPGYLAGAIDAAAEGFARYQHISNR